LLEAGALAERDTFQGERCIYNALNERIRNLLLAYDYSKSTDPLQPWAAHITGLLSRTTPKTADLTITALSQSVQLHKFILSARSPYFQNKLADAPETTLWRLPQTIPVESLDAAIRYLYLEEIPNDLVKPWSTCTLDEILAGVDKISKQLGITGLWQEILNEHDRRLARQRHQDEVHRAGSQIELFFQEKVIRHKMVVDVKQVENVKWRHDNSVFADCLLRADEAGPDMEEPEQQERFNGIPIGPGAESHLFPGEHKSKKAVLYPVHKAMLIRSPYFETMFSSQFREAQDSEHLHIITVDCLPEVLEIILTFLYTEKVECPLELGVDLLYASDMLFLDQLKTKAASMISSLGSGNNNLLTDRTHPQDDGAGQVEVEPINVYDIIHAAWDLKVQRLEEFAARYLAYRLEDYIDEKDFEDLIQESASRITRREETDTIELLDDIRFYLSERFRLRFDDAGLDELLDEKGELDADSVEAMTAAESIDGKESISAPPKEDSPADEKVDRSQGTTNAVLGIVRTLDGELVEDEFISDAMNYQILLQKIDVVLGKLKLDA
jgi:ankyrin repeat and BTB/POZ domain-containing protein 1